MLLAGISANSIHSLRELSHLGILDLVHRDYGPPQLCRSAVTINTIQYSCVVGADHMSYRLSTRMRCELDNVKVSTNRYCC